MTAAAANSSFDTGNPAEVAEQGDIINVFKNVLTEHIIK